MSTQSIGGGGVADTLAPATNETEHTAPRFGLLGTVLKNIFFFAVVIGSWTAVDTGYFSNDRTSRGEWNEMERLKAKGQAKTVYEADFSKVRIDGPPIAEGDWKFYNGASGDTVKIEDGALVLNYSSAWIGSEFRHAPFVPKGVYRVTIEAKVAEEPAAILMRNRQMDLMREQIPVTNGDFKSFTYHYVAPDGGRDRVRVIFMPDNRGEPKGRMTVRKFVIQRLEG